MSLVRSAMDWPLTALCGVAPIVAGQGACRYDGLAASAGVLPSPLAGLSGPGRAPLPILAALLRSLSGSAAAILPEKGLANV